MKRQIVSLISLSMVLSAAVLQGQEKRDSLKEKAIEEVVLVNVGYGTQKKSVVTGSHGRKIFLPTFLFFFVVKMK